MHRIPLIGGQAERRKLARCRSRHIMVGKGKGQAAAVIELGDGAGNRAFHLLDAQAGPFQQVEIIGGVEPPRLGEGRADLDGIVIVAVALTHQEPVLIAVGDLADRLAEELDGRLVELRRVVQLAEERLLVLRQGTNLELGVRRIVAIGRAVAVDGVHGVEPEAVHAAVEPETRDIHHRLAHRRVGMVQVRLARQEIVKVILLAARLPAPGAATEKGQPVGRRRAVRLGIGPVEPVGLVVVARLPAFDKPAMLLRAMGRHDVDHQLHAEIMDPLDHGVEIVQRPVFRIDRAIVGHVIAEILLRRGEERADPDRIDAEIGDIGQPRGDARQIADAIAVRILE